MKKANQLKIKSIYSNYQHIIVSKDINHLLEYCDLHIVLLLVRSYLSIKMIIKLLVATLHPGKNGSIQFGMYQNEV